MNPVFDPDELHELAREACHLPIDDAILFLHATLLERYPTHIERRPEWLLNQAGTSLGQFLTLHCSLHEYLIVFGTPIGTSGHSGRFRADDYFMVLTGEQQSYEPGALEPETYRPGDCNLMRRGHVTGFKLAPGTFALEYARGWIPGMLPFGLADTLTSNLDFAEMGHLFKIFTRNATRELVQKLPGGLPLLHRLGVIPDTVRVPVQPLRHTSARDDAPASSGWDVSASPVAPTPPA